MRILEKDYEYLLLNLIPRHRLRLQRRKQLEKAIRVGEPAEMRRAAIYALEDLCGTGHFRRRGTEVSHGQVLITYVRDSGHYQICLQVPMSQWRQMNGVPDNQDRSQVAAEGAGVDTTFAILPAIIRSLSINNRRESTFQRLESIVALLPSWFELTLGKLILNEERVGEEHRGDLVVTLPERAIHKRAVYRRCQESGKTEYLDLDNARTQGLLEPPGSFGGDTRVAVVPISPLGESVGVLELWFQPSTDGGAIRQRIDAAGRMVEQIMENALRLENLTSIDKLTGVFNRNHYDTQVRIEIERAMRSSSKLSMLILDVDDFKKINDTLGHRKGDEALVTVAALVRKNLRKIDLAFRYGGEEFVVLLPGTAEVEAVHTAERLRAVIEEARQFTDTNGETVPIHVSIGGAVFPDHAGSEEELFSRADSALYRAKRRGKNRVEFYGES